jgi:hypothetical protein
MGQQGPLVSIFKELSLISSEEYASADSYRCSRISMTVADHYEHTSGLVSQPCYEERKEDLQTIVHTERAQYFLVLAPLLFPSFVYLASLSVM